MNIYTVEDEPCLVIDNEKKILVVADLHLGIEYELYTKGVRLGSVTRKIKESLEKIVEKNEIDEIIFLGDLKHNIPLISFREERDVPHFLDLPVDFRIIKGNHDGNIETLTSKKIHNKIFIDNILLTHGHLKITERPECIIIGHSHPAVTFRDDIGKVTKEKCFLFGSLKNEKSKIIVVPAFSPLIIGISIDKERIPGYFFKNDRIDMKNLKIYLLDHTYLGKFKDLV
ncbi:MAG: metallophosphoesterase [Methanomicrobia archaeon]|nr:metallophosphoesterase [Methanomicrobia archaeon]MCK4310104.1 metallophosphoesterase [Methanomicrobia archaeon]MCK4637262.1 metallophosphoesterase [Methanomicrobia archaeon]